MNDGQEEKPAKPRRALSLADQAWSLHRIIQQWTPPAPGCAGTPVWMDEDMIEDMRLVKKTLDVMAFYGADQFVRREAEKKRKAR